MLKIKECRQKREISLSKLSKLAGVSKSYLWQLENEEGKSPSGEILYRISRELGASMPILMGKAENLIDISCASATEISSYFAGFTDVQGHKLELDTEFIKLVERAVTNIN